MKQEPEQTSTPDTCRYLKGGAWNDWAYRMNVGRDSWKEPNLPATSATDNEEFKSYKGVGFCICRSSGDK